MIGLDPAVGVGQRAVADEVRGALRRHQVQEIELALHRAGRAVGPGDLEPGLVRLAVDLDQGLVEVEVGAVALDVLHQWRHEVGNAEQHRAGRAEVHLDAGQHTLPQPVVAGQVHGLLRRAGAFDRHRRLGEQRPSAAQALYLLPGVGRQLEHVVAGHAVLAEGFPRALDGVPVEGQAGADDQGAVAETAAVFQHHLLLLRLEGAGGGADPLRLAGDAAGHGALGARAVEHPGTDQGPAGLVVVLVARLDDGDAQTRVALEQAGGDCAAGGAATDNQHIVARRVRVGGHRLGLVGQGLPALLEARLQGGKVVAGLLGGGQQRLGIEVMGLGQRPQGGGAGAGAAEG
ncbi:hypothetical protein D3C86_1411940 [compost metagenome]